MKIENHKIDTRQKPRVRMSCTFENPPTDTSGHLRTVLDTSGHQKKNPFFRAFHSFGPALTVSRLRRLSNFDPEFCSLEPASRGPGIKLYKTSLNFFNPKKRNPLFCGADIGSYHFLTVPNGKIKDCLVAAFCFYRTALTNTNASAQIHSTI